MLNLETLKQLYTSEQYVYCTSEKEIEIFVYYSCYFDRNSTPENHSCFCRNKAEGGTHGTLKGILQNTLALFRGPDQFR